MRCRRLVTALSVVALVALVTGCAGPNASSLASDTVSAAPASAGDLGGTWRGTLGWVGGHQYEDEALITLRIGNDGRFTGTVTPNRGTNNLARASSWAGTVVSRGNRVTLRNSEGPWTWLTLVRSGNTLYGVAGDPAAEANVMLKFERDDRRE